MDFNSQNYLPAETILPDPSQVYQNFAYPTTSTGAAETSATHLELGAFGVEVHDFNRRNEQGGFAQRRDDYVDTVTGTAVDYVSRDNSTNFNLAGSGWYFSEKCPLTARDLVGRDYHDIYEYVYAVNQIHHGSGETLSGPAMRVVNEAIELGWGIAVVPEEIRELAQSGYDQWYVQALDAASDGRLNDAYRDMEQVSKGYALLGNEFDAELAIEHINENLHASKAMNLFTRPKLERESEVLAQKFMTDVGASSPQDALASSEQ